MEKKHQVKRIFDSISDRYDFLNHLLSFGIDYYWRYKALKKTKLDNNSILLDVACGTGDFSISARKRGASNIFGTDFSLNMLKNFNEKSNWIIGRNVQAVAEALPYKSNTFTNITVAFGVRNFYDLQKGFEEFYRVLNYKGKVTVLEFRLPDNVLLKSIYNFYFSKILPVIGKLISKDKEAYTYLPESVSKFDEEIDLKKLFKEVGFNNINLYSMTFGIVQIVIAEK